MFPGVPGETIALCCLLLAKQGFTVSWLHAHSASLIPAGCHKGWVEQCMNSACLAFPGCCVQVELPWSLLCFRDWTCTKCSEWAICSA